LIGNSIGNQSWEFLCFYIEEKTVIGISGIRIQTDASAKFLQSGDTKVKHSNLQKNLSPLRPNANL
jgi:hypothetical protein